MVDWQDGGNPLPKDPLWLRAAALTLVPAIGALLIADAILGWGLFELAAQHPRTLKSENIVFIEGAVLFAMILLATQRGRLTALFGSASTLLVVGGALIFTSGFYKLVYLNANISIYGQLSWFWSWFAVNQPRLLYIGWPLAVGFLAAIFSYLRLVFPGRLAAKAQWLLPALLLGALCATRLGTYYSSLNRRVEPEEVFFFYVVSPAAVLVLLALGMLVGRSDDRRTGLVFLTAALSLVPAFHPEVAIPLENGIERAMPKAELFRFCGPGYWMLVTGVVLMLLGSLSLMFGKRPAAVAQPS